MNILVLENDRDIREPEHLGKLVSKKLNRALDAFARINVEDALVTIDRWISNPGSGL